MNIALQINLKQYFMKKNIAILSGGNSGEYEISIQSGNFVAEYLDFDLYNPYQILIKGKDWFYKAQNGKEFFINKNDFSLKTDEKKVLFDCVFIAIHGTPGEDGKLQGYFDMLKIPYTSCNLTTSALTFNKSFCKSVVSSLGVLTAESIHIHKKHFKDISEILKTITLPCFVKPNNGGSSVGMSRVNKPEDLLKAIYAAFMEDDEVLIEEFIKGREISCGIVKYRNELIVLPIAEIISKKEFFDYEAKYDPELAEEIIPAPITIEVEKECKKISSFLFEKLNCSGVVRFDYIFNDSGLYFLEVNTIPGLTENSIIPKMAKNIGISFQKLFSMIIAEALDS